MYILGINAAFHDSSAALLEDGRIVAAAEEERFTRIKHGKRPMPLLSYQLPFHAIAYCLREAGIRLRDVDRIAYSYDPGLALDPGDHEGGWDSGFGRYEAAFIEGIRRAPNLLLEDVPHHLSELTESVTDVAALPPFAWVEHHLAHAGSAYYPSGFGEAAILTLDGRGELTTTLAAHGSGGEIRKLREVRYPHSLGLLYEDVTQHLGFLRSSDEYKVMALGASGTPRFVPAFAELVAFDEAGGYTIGREPLNELFGPPRRRGEPLEQRHFDLAHALQETLERGVLSLARWVHRETGSRRLCMAGGVALNCVMNARVRDEGPFEEIFVQPAAGDAGTSLGAAYAVYAQEQGWEPGEAMSHAYLGPEYTDEEILRELRRAKVAYERPDDIAEAVAALLAEDQIAGWFQGRMEFGPRALGARSIVASPRDPLMKDRLNAIKDREEFRPVAPAVLAEQLADYFDPPAADPFMLFVSNVRPERAGEIPAVCHFDGTARLQSVSREAAPAFHALISAFERRTGTPVIVNTSFNTLGRPIVCTPGDALECFFTTPLDALAIGPYLLRKPAVSGERSV